ncbi:unspecified product [Plasmodium gonderi]|uniref:Unspecified product n=1 Tax=Plasmodium gonderi TaxID=77519 RepID=A0A1Y1JN16_PLAGO|nr:unspecified product [Plasmodium gonderi]GAW83861.1 unspecified product [Plasmodium gonderi]
MYLNCTHFSKKLTHITNVLLFFFFFFPSTTHNPNSSLSIIPPPSRNPNCISINNDNVNKRRDAFNNMQNNSNLYPAPPPSTIVHMNEKNMINKKPRMDNRAINNENINYTMPQNFIGMHPYIPPPMHDVTPNKLFSNMHHNQMKTNRNSNSFSRR